MAFRKGMRGIKDAVDQTKKDFGGGGWMRYFSLGDGETASVLFLGTPETEPALSREHSIKDGNKFSSIQHRENDCVACHVNTGGDRRVGRPSVRARFTFFDLRWARKRKDKERSAKDGQDRYKYEPIEEDVVTDEGIRKGVYVRRGKCGWRMPAQWAQALETAEARVNKKCKNCGKGRISVSGYEGAKTKGLDDEEIEELLEKGKIKEVLECSKCDDPERTSVFNSVVEITRSGTKKSTSYQFSVTLDDIPTEGMPEEMPEAYDWDSVDGEPSTSAQAQALGVRDPFSSGKGSAASSYDEDDDDDDPFESDDDDDEDPLNDDDEDDEEDKPAAKRMKTSGAKKVASKKTPLRKKKKGGLKVRR